MGLKSIGFLHELRRRNRIYTGENVKLHKRTKKHDIQYDVLHELMMCCGWYPASSLWPSSIGLQLRGVSASRVRGSKFQCANRMRRDRQGSLCCGLLRKCTGFFNRGKGMVTRIVCQAAQLIRNTVIYTVSS